MQIKVGQCLDMLRSSDFATHGGNKMETGIDGKDTENNQCRKENVRTNWYDVVVSVHNILNVFDFPD